MGATTQVTESGTTNTASASISVGAAERTDKASRPKRHNSSRLFGYDVFISFALGPPPRGSHSYASDLARRLRERDFTVFFSEDEAAPGEQLDSTLLKALHRSRILVVIANRGTLEEPRWVRHEVEEFRRRHPDRPIIPISVDRAVEDAELAEQTQQWLKFGDKIWLDETDDAVAHGIATKELVERLALAPAGRSSNVKWRWVVRAVAAGLVGLAGAATWFGINAKRQARESKARELAAYATESLNDDRQQSMLLSMQAVNTTLRHRQPPLSSAEEALHQTFLSSGPWLTLRGHTSEVTSVAWSPDGKRLATGSKDGMAMVWDAASGQELLYLIAARIDLTSVAWSPDGKRLATASIDGTAKVWDAASGQELLSLLHTSAVNSVAWSPDGERLATVSSEGEVPYLTGAVKVWDAGSGKVLLTLLGHKRDVNSVAWSPDGKWLATGGEDRMAIWDAASWQEVRTLPGGFGTSVAWTRDSKRLAEGSWDGIVVWDTDSWQVIDTLLGEAGRVRVYSVAWSPDGNRLVTANGDRAATVWEWNGDMSKWLEEQTLRGHSGNVTSVAWSPDGQRLATGSEDNTAKLWDTASGHEQATPRDYVEVQSVAWSSDGKRLATGGVVLARVWDATSGREMQAALRGHSGIVWSVAWSPDGKRLATGSADKTAKVWDTAGKEDPLTLSGHHGGVLTVAWSPDGKRLATGSDDNTVKVWDAATSQVMQTLHGHTGQVRTVAWSPDGKRLATGSADKTAKVWDTTTWREMQTLRGHTHVVESVAWSPDSKRLATGSYDKTVKVWDLASGQEPVTLRGQTKFVQSVAWSPDGKRLASADEDPVVQIYEMDIYDLLKLARSRVGRDFTLDECLKYFQSKTCPAMP